MQIYFWCQEFSCIHTETLQIQQNLSTATKLIYHDTLSDKFKVTFHSICNNFIGGTKVSEIHNKLLISDIKQWLGGYLVYMSTCLHLKESTFFSMLLHQVPFSNHEIFQKQFIQLHTSQWSSNIELSSPLKMTRSNKNFLMHALSYVWMKLSIQYKYSHS